MARRFVSSLAVLAPLLAVILGGAVASAARPAKGARYYGVTGKVTKGTKATAANLKVAGSERAFSRGKLSAGCGLTADFGPRVRIRRGGRFFLRSRGLRLRGRFLASGYGRISYRARARRGHRKGLCRSNGTVTIYRNGKPAFKGCSSPGAKTIFRNSVARVFRQYVGDAESFESHLFACLLGGNKRVDLGLEENESDPDTTDVIALGGPFVAIKSGGCPPAGGACSSGVEILDLRTGTRKNLEYQSSLGCNSVTDMELRDNGSAAFIIHGYPSSLGLCDYKNENLEVWVSDSHGPHMVDAGPKIKKDSLTLSGTTVSWVNDGVTKTATID